ncbi:MAG: mannitol dehydrogenase family protein [Brevinema sp.]
MKLSLETLQDKQWWHSKDYITPKFNIKEVVEYTSKNPTWLHFGAGNIFRIFPALIQQKLLNQGLSKTGIIVCETFDEQIISKAYKPYDNLGIGVTLKSSGTIRKEIITSITETLTKRDFDRLLDIAIAPSLQMISFTITEKGYALKNMNGEYFPDVQEDLNHFTQKSLMGLITYLCYCRFERNAAPLTLVSMDNCSHNGTVLKDALMQFVDAWLEKGFVTQQFRDYMLNKELIYFPWTMIDKITPRPSEQIAEMLKNDGLEGTEVIITDKNSYISVFVNAEETEYLAIEDKFPNGRPPFEEVGILFGDRKVVDKIEKMKVCTCLNPLHTALAIYGNLLNYTLISEEIKDANLRQLIMYVGYREGLPVVVDPQVINPKEFIDTVINVRLPNPYMPDSPKRIASDTSQKLAIRFGETIKAYLIDPSKDVRDLQFIPLVLAGWLRYLMGVDDEGNIFELSSDPRLEELTQYVSEIKLGDTEVSSNISTILSDQTIFAVDLYEVGLAPLVEEYFLQLIAGKGAVRKTLQKYCS